MFTLALLLAPIAHAADPGFLYLTAAVPQSNVNVVVAVGGRTNGADRFVDPGVGRAGFVQQVDGTWAVKPWLAVGADALMSVANPEDRPVSGAGGAFVQVASPSDRGPRFGGELGGHREFSGAWALTFSGSLEVPLGAVRLGIAPKIEHRFDADADPIDLMLPFAADVGVGEKWRFGAEAVGEDLEAYADDDDDAEGGATWLAAGTAQWQTGHAHIALAPGVGITPLGVGFAGRALAGWTF